MAAYLANGDLHRITILINHLLAEPATRQQLARKTGYNEDTIGDYISYWRALKNPALEGPNKRMVRIARQEKVGKHVIAAFEWNTTGALDAPRPKPIPRAEIERRYRLRKKAGAFAELFRGQP